MHSAGIQVKLEALRIVCNLVARMQIRSDAVMLKPGEPFPDLSVPLISGDQWRLDQARHELTLISVIRGYFCAFCHDAVVDLNRNAEALANIGVGVLTTSTDEFETAKLMRQELSLEDLPVGFGLTESDIRRLSLFATERGGKIFAEPAILIARSNGTVYAVFQTSISCGRLEINRLVEGLELLKPAGFPLRGNA
jgi:peroxiredoxin